VPSSLSYIGIPNIVYVPLADADATTGGIAGLPGGGGKLVHRQFEPDGSSKSVALERVESKAAIRHEGKGGTLGLLRGYLIGSRRQQIWTFLALGDNSPGASLPVHLGSRSDTVSFMAMSRRHNRLGQQRTPPFR
jgi:hypothetical protein